jgi:predicted kinase
MSWSKDYKKSIDCNNPKGFSQKAHCDGRKAREAGKKTKSKSVSEMNENIKNIIIEILTEGVDDPGILKCVFMAGGPGSGKSYTAKEIFGVGKNLTASFSVTGLKIVNSDSAFEKGMKDNGIDPKNLAKIEKEDPELWDKITGKDSIRSKAKALTQKQQSFYEAGRLGMIIDGTGDEVQKIKAKKQHAESLGYDCYMVFVNTSLEVALERNAKRDRTLPDDLVTDIWKACQNNLGKFQSIFSGNMVIVDNTVYKPINKNVQKAVDAFVRKPIKNRIGLKWVQTARLLKKAKLIKEGNQLANTAKLYLESIKEAMVKPKSGHNYYQLTKDFPIRYIKGREGLGLEVPGVLLKNIDGYIDGKKGAYLIDYFGAMFYVDMKKKFAAPVYSLKDQNKFQRGSITQVDMAPEHSDWKRYIKENLKERINLFVEENEPTNPELWDRAIAAAKAKYDVYPSAYANAFASKWYGDKGGKWRTKKD